VPDSLGCGAGCDSQDIPTCMHGMCICHVPETYHLQAERVHAVLCIQELMSQHMSAVACPRSQTCVVTIHKSPCSIIQLNGLSLMHSQHAFHLQLRCKNHTKAMMLQEGMFGLREWEDEGFMPPTQDADDPSYDPSGSVRKARQPSARVYLSALDCCLLFHSSAFSTFLPCRCCVWPGPSNMLRISIPAYMHGLEVHSPQWPSQTRNCVWYAAITSQSVHALSHSALLDDVQGRLLPHLTQAHHMYMLQLFGYPTASAVYDPVLLSYYPCACVCVDPSLQLQIDHDVLSRVRHLNFITWLL